jgi:hypothetical protein
MRRRRLSRAALGTGFPTLQKPSAPSAPGRTVRMERWDTNCRYPARRGWVGQLPREAITPQAQTA